MIYRSTRILLDKYSFVLKKKYGQNFLIDEGALETIAGAADINKEDIVLEIGPGIGTLTQYLCENAKHVIAIEIDNDLIPILDEVLEKYDNCDIINGDALKTDIKGLISELKDRGVSGDYKVAANLPYYITTPVMMKLIESKVRFDSMIFMVQKEVAERLTAKPGEKNYGAITLACEYYADLDIVDIISPDAFIPRPKVESAIVRLRSHKEPPVAADRTLLFKIIRASFNQRRKTLVNGISNFEGLSYSKDEIRNALVSLGFDENIRGEKLSLKDFSDLADILSGKITK